MSPLYLEKLTIDELREKSIQLKELLYNCRICPNECEVNRFESPSGKCYSTSEIMISSLGPHFGEEQPLVGTNGSGTIFLTNCNLSCVFCQNYDISQQGRGETVSVSEFADAMMSIQNRGCHNLNLVSPTHYIPQIVEALTLAIEKGFELPIVYNCGGYESVETLRLLEDVIDIYMPDIKYSEDAVAEEYSGITGYWTVVQKAIKEMHRQVGDLKISKRGIAQRGLLIRHLVLPNAIAGSNKIIDFIAEQISTDTYLNIMNQYHPAFKSYQHPEIHRRITKSEYSEVIKYAKERGLTRGIENTSFLIQ